MPKRIPINQAKAFAIANDLKQVIIAAWDGKLTHIVTYGDTVEACAQAALGGNKIKKALGWPADLNAEPSRVQDLLDRIQMLESLNGAQASVIKSLQASAPAEVQRTVHVIQGTEYERGWGQRPDGYVAFATKEAAEAWIKDYDAKYNNLPAAPDEYTRYSYIGLKECSAAMHGHVKSSGTGAIHLDRLDRLFV